MSYVQKVNAVVAEIIASKVSLDAQGHFFR
jgi:hypothetical protein